MADEAGIRAMLAEGPFALIGAGQLGKMTLDMWPAGEPKPLFFVDSAREGEFCGLPVHRLGGQLPAGITYLVSAFKMPAATAKSIFAALGQDTLLTSYDFFEERVPLEFSNGWRNLEGGPDLPARLAAARAAYADETSRLIHDCAAAWRYQRELRDDYPVTPEERKYDLSTFGRAGTRYDLVIDGGAYDLGTLGMLTAGGVTFDRVIAFEADPARYADCLSRAASMPGVTVRPEALADFNGEADFLATGLLSARLAAPGLAGDPRLRRVPVVRLDTLANELLEGGPLDAARVLLKLHIEGAELPALKGAADILADARVDILLNLSHDEASLLDLPVYLESFGRFDIFLRSHALYGEGLTLFARYRD